MIRAFLNFKNSLWVLFIFLLSLSVAASFGAYMGLSLVVDDQLIVALLTFGVLFLLTSLSATYIIKRSLFGLGYLVQAVAAVALQNSRVAAPNPNKLTKSTAFLNDVSSGVYALAGSQPEAQTSSDVNGSKPNLSQLALPAVAIDPEGKLVFSNSTAAAYFGFDSKQAIGADMGQIFHFNFSAADKTLDQWLEYCRANKATASQSWDHIRHDLSDDSSRYFDMVAHYSKNNPNGYELLLVFIDQTDRYQQEYRDVSFVAMAVHELRTPLTVMRGYMEVFEDELGQSLNQEQRQFMSNMTAQSQQLANFVSNILNVARVEENQLHIKLRKESWPDIIRKTVADMDLRARVQGIEIQYSLPENLPEVAVDKVSMYEVLNNLLDNAIKYTHDKRPIKIQVQQIDESWIETTVTDQGVGIPPNVMRNLFKKFYRSYRSNKSAVGTGLGLFISKNLVNAHGGQIWAKSHEEQGSTFGFTVPTYQSVADSIKTEDNEIIREAHGWIKNHTMYRG